MSSSRLKIGYSCWGFLGNGIVDTPDGGRSHRITLLQSLINDQNAEIFMLQKNRDLLEAGDDITIEHLSFVDELPDVDFVFLEYRWPIQGRNIDIAPTDPMYTPDLDRQNEIISHYNLRNTPLLIWDKDQQINDIPIELSRDTVILFEPALAPRSGRLPLLFPADEKKLTTALGMLEKYTKATRKKGLIYIGNQYDRDESFNQYYIDAALEGMEVDVYGKWRDEAFPKTPSLVFHGRVAYSEVQSLYERALCHVIIAPDRYYTNAQYTQRIFESIWAGCIPLIPKEYHLKELLYPESLYVKTGKEVARKVRELNDMPDHELARLLSEVVQHLQKYFSPKTQTSAIVEAYKGLL